MDWQLETLIIAKYFFVKPSREDRRPGSRESEPNGCVLSAFAIADTQRWLFFLISDPSRSKMVNTCLVAAGLRLSCQLIRVASAAPTTKPKPETTGTHEATFVDCPPSAFVSVGRCHLTLPTYFPPAPLTQLISKE